MSDNEKEDMEELIKANGWELQRELIQVPQGYELGGYEVRDADDKLLAKDVESYDAAVQVARANMYKKPLIPQEDLEELEYMIGIQQQLIDRGLHMETTVRSKEFHIGAESGYERPGSAISQTRTVGRWPTKEYRDISDLINRRAIELRDAGYDLSPLADAKRTLK